MDAVFFCRYLPGLNQLIPLMETLGGTMWTNDGEVARAMRRRAGHLPCRRYLLARRGWVERRARHMEGDVFIGTNAHPFFFNRVPGPRVQCFHGVSSKGFAAQWRNTRYFDLALLAGERMRQAFERAGLLDTLRCEVVGHIHGDRLTHGDHDVAGFERRHGLDAQAPTVLYAPTWSGLSSFNDRGLEIVEAVPRAWNLVVKLHPWTVRRREAPATLRAVQGALRRRPHAALLPHDADIHPAMAASDMMIGDRSSTCEEYLMLDRPLILFDHLTDATDLNPETRDLLARGDWSDLHRCGPVVESGAALTEALEQMQRDPSALGEERRRMRDSVFHAADGQATQRAASAIRRLAEETRGHVFGERVIR